MTNICFDDFAKMESLRFPLLEIVLDLFDVCLNALILIRQIKLLYYHHITKSDVSFATEGRKNKLFILQ